MSTVTLAYINLFAAIVMCTGLYLIGRVFIPIAGEKDTFFSSPKLGRIKARKRGGRIVGFFDNLAGKGKHTNKKTGKIELGETGSGGFWWTIFGAYFIGLDEVNKYNIATEVYEESGKITYKEIEASSIFLEGSYPLSATFISRDGVGLKVRIQLKLTTVDAAKGLSLPISWTIPVFAAVLATSRDFFGAGEIRKLIAAQNEGGGENVGVKELVSSDYIQRILNLNTPKVGNISLEEICGQRIDAVNIVDIDFADEETRQAFSAPFIAEQVAQKQVKEAEAYASAVRIISEADKSAAVNIAAATTLKGNAEAGVYGKKHEGLGNDPRSTAQVITAEKHSTMENLTTLVNGGNSMLSIPVGDTKKQKK
jgi:regulator of protease activity HflC (stomatin/prohibitin superfamily)